MRSRVRPGRLVARRGALFAAPASSLLPRCVAALAASADAPAASGRQRDALAVEQAFLALERCFGPTRISPAYAAAREAMARAALVPSRVFDAQGLWPQREGEERRIEYTGGAEGQAYVMDVAIGAPAPAQPGDYRCRLALRRLGPGEYAWRCSDELALGDVPVSAVGRGLEALLAAASARAAAAAGALDARADLRRALPRASAVLGRCWRLDRLALAATPEGATEVALEAVLLPNQLAPTAPHYARFLERQALPLRYRVEVADADGPWWTLSQRDGRLALRLRAHGGRLVPLSGPPRPFPDALRATLDLTTRSGLFRAGFEALTADVQITRAPRAASFRARFARAPEWALPFLLEPLLRGSLRRPFEGPGASFELGLGEALGMTRVERSFGIEVRESWILRWLGGLAGSAVGEFRAEAEAEADEFTRELLQALRRDLLALLAAAPARTGAPEAAHAGAGERWYASRQP